MAIGVLVTQAGGPDPWPTGAKEAVNVSINLRTDYQSPFSWNTDLFLNVPDATSKVDAIQKALNMIDDLADGIKAGLAVARKEHPVGS